MVKGPGLAQLPVSAVTIEPAQLAPDKTEFQLKAAAGGCTGGTYVWKVNAHTPAGGPPETVWAWITVP